MSLESEIIQFFKAVAFKKNDRESSRLLVLGREEEKGIWRVELSSGEKFLFDYIDVGNLSADFEGLDIYESKDRRVLLASSQ